MYPESGLRCFCRFFLCFKVLFSFSKKSSLTWIPGAFFLLTNQSLNVDLGHIFERALPKSTSKIKLEKYKKVLRMKSKRMKCMRMKGTQMKSIRMKSMRTKSIRMKRLRMKSTQMTTIRIKCKRIKSIQMISI